MKALSLTQPWATLVANGSKRIETRSWRTSFHGEIAIHASKGFPGWAKDYCSHPAFVRALRNGDLSRPIYPPGMLPLGSIIAVAHLAHIMPTEQDASPPLGWSNAVYRRPEPDTPEFKFGDYSPRRFMWFLENVRDLREPVPCRGALSLWDVPEDVEAAVREQLKRAA